MTTILTPAEQATLTATAGRIVPAHDTLPSAGELGVATILEATLAQTPPLRRIFLDGLRAIALASGEQEFSAHSADEQDAMLRAIESAHPAFFNLLVEHTYRAYYALPVVQRALGLSGEPPQPRGYHLSPFDPALLTLQRQRDAVLAQDERLGPRSFTVIGRRLIAQRGGQVTLPAPSSCCPLLRRRDRRELEAGDECVERDDIFVEDVIEGGALLIHALGEVGEDLARALRRRAVAAADNARPGRQAWR